MIGSLDGNEGNRERGDNVQDTQDTEMLTVPETAAAIRCSIELVYKMIANGQIPAARLGRKVMVPRRALNIWLERFADAATIPAYTTTPDREVVTA